MKKGFTLIELLVVVVILALLASVIVVNVDNARKTSRDAKRRADIIAIQNALEQYYASNNKYPTAATAVNSGSGSWNTAINGLTPNYMQVIPKDPVNKNTLLYYYISDAVGNNYKLYASSMETEEGRSWATEDGGSKTDSFEVFSPSGQAL